MASVQAAARALVGQPVPAVCVLGMAYGIVLMAIWLAARAGYGGVAPGTLAPHLWHGHEMLFDSPPRSSARPC